MRWIVVVCVLPFALGACSSSQPSSTTSSDSSPGVSSNEIVLSELSEPVDGLSAYEVVRRYNSDWLRKRGPTSFNNPNPINVYLDNTGSPYGTVEALQDIRAADVALIRHYDARQAQFKFGVGNVSGAILVETKSGGE